MAHFGLFSSCSVLGLPGVLSSFNYANLIYKYYNFNRFPCSHGTDSNRYDMVGWALTGRKASTQTEKSFSIIIIVYKMFEIDETKFVTNAPTILYCKYVTVPLFIERYYSMWIMKSLHCVFTVICSLSIEYSSAQITSYRHCTMSHEPWAMGHDPWRSQIIIYAGANMCIYLIACLHFIITTGNQSMLNAMVSVFSGDFRVVKMPLGGDVDTWLGRVATLWEIFGFIVLKTSWKIWYP